MKKLVKKSLHKLMLHWFITNRPTEQQFTRRNRLLGKIENALISLKLLTWDDAIEVEYSLT